MNDFITTLVNAVGDYCDLVHDDEVYWDSYTPGVTPILDQVLFEFWNDDAWD